METFSLPTLTFWREGHLPERDYASYEDPHDTMQSEVTVEEVTQEE